MFLDRQLREINEKFHWHTSSAPEVSKANVAWHLDHVLRVNIAVCHQLIKSDNKKKKYPFNLATIELFILGKIPRGVKEAPTYVSSENEVTVSTLERRLRTLSELLPQLENCHPENGFKHQELGWMNVERARNFMQLHTNHHLEIIKDIITSETIDL